MIKKKIRKILICTIPFVISLVSSYCIEKNYINVEEYLIGENYTQGQILGKKLYVSFLKKGIRLEKRCKLNPYAEGWIMLPYEGYVSAYIIKDNKIIKKVDSLNSLQGFVEIDNIEKAMHVNLTSDIYVCSYNKFIHLTNYIET